MKEGGGGGSLNFFLYSPTRKHLVSFVVFAYMYVTILVERQEQTYIKKLPTLASRVDFYLIIYFRMVLCV